MSCLEEQAEFRPGVDVRLFAKKIPDWPDRVCELK